MKLVCNKQVTAVVDIYNYGGGFNVTVDGKSLADVAASECNIEKTKGKQFPARVTLVIEDLTEDRSYIPDPEEQAKKLINMIKMMRDEAEH